MYSKEKKKLFVVPQNMIVHVMQKYHDEMGHFSVEKTCGAIRDTYLLPKLRETVKSYIDDCLKCIAYNPVTGRAEGYLHSIPKENVPFSSVHIDQLLDFFLFHIFFMYKYKR